MDWIDCVDVMLHAIILIGVLYSFKFLPPHWVDVENEKEKE
jgi:hypothetical protein